MKILVRSPNWIGDAVVSTACVRALRNYFRDSFIAVLAKDCISDIWIGNPYINRIILYKASEILPIRKQKFDLGIILPNSFSSAFYMFLANVKERIGYATQGRSIFLTYKIPLYEFKTKHIINQYLNIIKTLGVPPEETQESTLEILPHEESKAELILIENEISKYDELIGICPGATYGPAKRWSKESFAELGKILANKYKMKILLFGSLQERKLLEFIKEKIGEFSYIFPGNLSLRVMAALIKKCKVFITNDTGPMHIASALSIPVLAIFGSTSPLWTSPLGENNEIIYKALPCSPCFKMTCKYKNYLCFKEISVNEVLSTVNKLLVKTL